MVNFVKEKMYRKCYETLLVWSGNVKCLVSVVVFSSVVFSS